MTTSLRQVPDHRITFAVLCSGMLAFSILQSIVNPVIPTIQRELDTDQSTITWIVTGYLLSASVFTPLVGRIGDKVGKGRMLVVALAILSFGSVLAALAPTIGLLIVARVLQGIGGGVIPLTFGLIRDVMPPEKVAGAIGISSSLLAVGGGVGLVAAGPLVDALSYHWLFWLPAGATLAAAVAAAVYVPATSERKEGRLNFVSAVLLSTWLCALLLGISMGNQWGWTSARVLGLLVAAAVLLPVWVRSEARSDEPLVDMQMMRIPTVWTVNLVTLLFGFGLNAIFAFLPGFLQTPESTGYGFGVSIQATGFLMLPLTIGSFIAGMASGRLTHVVGSRLMLITGSVLTALALSGLAFAHDHVWQVGVESAVLGFALGLGMSATSNLVVQAVPLTQTGVASGVNANVRTVGGAIGCVVFASIVTAGGASGGFPVEASYVRAFGALLLVACVAAALACIVPRTADEAA